MLILLVLDHKTPFGYLSKYIVPIEDFRNTEIGFHMMRYTFCVDTQISTSRELNRVSPNSIAEKSTRYVYEYDIDKGWMPKETIYIY
nr:MAG: Thymidylate synthase complementing protein [Bacteriophage sp.]